MKKYIYYILGIAATMASCTEDVIEQSPYLNGSEKTPIAVDIAFDEHASLTRSQTRALDGKFQTDDLLLAYFKHVKVEDPINAPSVYADVNVTGTEPRFVGFKVTEKSQYENVADNYTDHSASSTLVTTDAAGVAKGLYWDDFSVGAKGEDTDIRTDNHYLQSYYGYCFNGREMSVVSENVSTGKLEWTILTDQRVTTGTPAVATRTDDSNFKKSDILWSFPQTPVPYNHWTSNANAQEHGKIEIPYYHAMSKVTIKLIADKGFKTGAFAKTTVTLKNVNTSCTLTPTSATADDRQAGITVGTTKSDVIMHGYSEAAEGSKPTCLFVAAIVPSTTIKVGETFAVISDVDGNNYTIPVTENMLNTTNAWGKSPHTVSADKSIQTHSAYNYFLTVTVNKQEVSVVSTLEDWSTLNATGTSQIEFEHDDDKLVYEDDGKPGTIEVEAVDENKFKHQSSFSLFDLKMTSSNENNSANRTNDSYQYVTVCTFDNPDDTDPHDDVWNNNPEIYWPNANDKYFFRALAKYNGTSDGVNDIEKVGNMTGSPVDKGLAVSQGLKANQDIIWGTSAKHYGKGPNYDADPNDLRTYQAGQAIPPRSGAVPIAFEHVMSKITFNLTTSAVEAAKVNLNDALISITNLFTTGTIKLEDGDITLPSAVTEKAIGQRYDASASPAPTYFTSKSHPASGATVLDEYIVVPQSFESVTADPVVSIQLKDYDSDNDGVADTYGTVYSIKLKDCVVEGSSTQIVQWIRGQHYIYTIHLEKEKIDFCVMLKDWEAPVYGHGDANMEWE